MVFRLCVAATQIKASSDYEIFIDLHRSSIFVLRPKSLGWRIPYFVFSDIQGLLLKTSLKIQVLTMTEVPKSTLPAVLLSPLETLYLG